MHCAPSGRRIAAAGLLGRRFDDLDGECLGEGQFDRVTDIHAFESFRMQHLDRARVAGGSLERHRRRCSIDRGNHDRRGGLTRERACRPLTQFGGATGNQQFWTMNVPAGATNLRDVIMFPMNQQAQDLLMGAPSEVTQKQLRELHIRLAVPERKS